MQGRENEDENEPLLIASDVLKIVSCHISSLKKAFESGFLDFIKIHSPDIICLQVQYEEAVSKNTLSEEKKKYSEIGSAKDPYLIEGYKGYIIANDSNTRKGETMMFTKIKPIKVSRTNSDEAQNEINDSSIMTIEFTNFFVVNVIAPRKARDEDSVNQWFKRLQKLLNDLDSQKTTILCGDFKVAHQALDISKSNDHKFDYYDDFSNQKRFSDFLSDNYVDIFRTIHPNKQQFSYFASISGNPGESKAKCRTDYFIAQNEAIETKIVIDCSISNPGGFSKHCPIILLLDREKLISTEHDLLVDSLSHEDGRNEIFITNGVAPSDESEEEPVPPPKQTLNQEVAPKIESQNTKAQEENNATTKKEDNQPFNANEEFFSDYFENDYEGDYEANESETSDEGEEKEIQLGHGHKVTIRNRRGRFFDFSSHGEKGGRKKGKSGKLDDDDYAPIKKPIIRSKPKPKTESSSSEPRRGRGRPKKVTTEDK